MKFLFLIGVLSMGLNSVAVANQPIFKGHAHFKIKPQYVYEFKKEVLKIIGPTLEEKGCISYEAYQLVNSKGEPTNEFVFHELWKSKEAMLVDHKDKAPHMIQFFSKIKIGKPDSYVESFDVSGHEVLRLE